MRFRVTSALVTVLLLAAALVASVGPATSAGSAAPAVSATCATGPLLTPAGGRRWWSHDQRCYGSPWFAGQHKIMIGFGCTPAPYYTHDPRCPGREGFHHGIDVDMPMRTPIYAAVRGTVVSTDRDGPAYGTQPVKIRSHGLDFLLGHLSRALVQVGQHVKRGQLVGLSGQSGAPDGPHLHFEVRPAGASYTRAIDPRPWLRLTTSPATPTTRSAPLATQPPPRNIVLDGVSVDLPSDSRQVITVDHTVGTFARVALWHLVDSEWVRETSSSHARTGYGGLVPGSQRRQSTGTTPLGTYPLVSTFGSSPRRPAWAMPYRRFDGSDYWVEDRASPYFNRMRSRRDGGFRWWLDVKRPNGSERLADYAGQYAMAVVVGFNYDDPVPGLGGGIFLHVNGPGPTAGCVSAPRSFVAAVLALLDPGADPVIAIAR